MHASLNLFDRNSGGSRIPKIGRRTITHDQFYTKSQVVERCLKNIDFTKYDAVIEPSAGTGAFSNIISHANLYALDIDPRCDSITKGDFFDFSIDSSYESVLVIGNPPFGIRHSLSDAFLRHSFSFPNVSTVAFILPNTYRKHTRQRIIPFDYRIKSIEDLGRDAFIYEDRAYHVPCSFFVIDKSTGADLRIDPSLHQEAVDFSFGTRHDFDLFMFGANPARIIANPTCNNRGYYIKPRGISLGRLVERIRAINWVGNSCANGGVAWFSKVEVVMQYNAKYG